MSSIPPPPATPPPSPPANLRSHYTTSVIRILSSDNQSFCVHSGLLGSKSTSLHSLVSGNWKERFDGVIDWSNDWDSDTVSHFLDWLYTGRYEAPYPTLAVKEHVNESISKNDNYPPSPPPPAAHNEPPAVVHGRALPTSGCWAELVPRKRPAPIQINQRTQANARPLTSLREIFRDTFPLQESKATFECIVNDQWRQRGYISSDFDFSTNFLTHVRLYHLATYHNIRDLQRLSLENLLEKLVLFDKGDSLGPATPAMRSVVELVRYVYDNIPARPEDREPARKIVSTFVAQNFAAFTGSGIEAEELLGEGGDFVVDVCRKVAGTGTTSPGKRSTPPPTPFGGW